MGEYHVVGGTALSGAVAVQRSKNAALPMIAASVLCGEPVLLAGCPDISDVRGMAELLGDLGAKVRRTAKGLYLDCRGLSGWSVMGSRARSMRSSVLFLGSLLSRCGQADLCYPGGCVIGERPIDLHLFAMERLGARIRLEADGLRARAPRLAGNAVTFPRPSVGATENALLAAVKAEGTTVLSNCAKEPEIVHLCGFLRAMGGRITGDGTERICVRGVGRLGGGRYEVPPDRIEAGTLLFAGAITRGRVTLLDAPVGEMAAVLSLYEKTGGQYTVTGGTLVTDSRGVRRAVPEVETAGYPGFPTDLQSPYLALAATLAGSSRIRETIFEDRLRTARELARMGAVFWEGNREIRTGKSRLFGARVTAGDLRGGAALTLAALAAEGRSVIGNVRLIERGYERFPEKLALLGAKIRKEGGGERALCAAAEEKKG